VKTLISVTSLRLKEIVVIGGFGCVCKDSLIGD
jgi:hypothetical protein